MLISEKDLAAVQNLHEQSLHLQAFKLAQSICPLPNWEGTEAVLLASHLAYNLGAPKTSVKWTRKAWRGDKKHPRALFYHASEILNTKGALPGLIFLSKQAENFQAEGKLLAWWYALHAGAFSFLRDFTTADEWHKKAIQTAPDEPWVWVSVAHSLELQDRYEESLAMCRKAFELKPWQRSSVFSTAHVLTLLERYDEALELLTEASTRLENSWVVKELADLQTELGLYKEAYASLEKLVELTPMREDKIEQWLYAGLSDAAYLNGDIQKAIRFADISSEKYHLKIKEKLENLKGTEKRVLLKLGFIRQHHVTCAPATISNIARFWQKPAEHLKVADEMCYDGTPAYKERLWAEANGWATAEFKVNWGNAVELINRGVPFTLTTIHPGNGHLQAIVGYDERRGTFLVRDPYFQRLEEYLAENLLEEQKASGPRGLALVPAEKSLELLGDILFEESREYDFHYAVDCALEKHDREKAGEIYAEMEKAFPNHRLTWSSKWAIARYDANTLQLLEAVENLRKQFPDDVNLKLSYLSVSNELTARAERLKTLEEFCKDEKTDPLLWQMFGYELGLDARHHSRALHWLYKTLRKLPTSGATYRFIADILWSKRRFEEATELYRLAASLDDKDEQFAFSYFLAARHLKQSEQALKFLRDRFERFGHRSNLPIQSLFYALRELGRTVEAFDALEDALKKRPADGELKLFAADAKARYGRKQEAERLLRLAEKNAPRGLWLRKAALLAEMDGNFKASLKNWREIIELEPLAYDAHEAVAYLLAATEGRKAAQDYLRELTDKFPFNRDLHKLRLNWLREEHDEAIAISKHLLELNPHDAWSYREYSRRLYAERKYTEALSLARAALELDAHDWSNYYACGLVLSELGKYDEAVEAYKNSIKLSVEAAEYALENWLNICRTKEEKLAALRFVRGELDRQTSFGDAVITYREQAKRLLEPEFLLRELQKFHAENKNAWFSASPVIWQLVDMYRYDEALELAEQATRRFPLVYQVWYDLSLVHKVRGENEQETAALRKALDINGSWSYGIQQLVESLQRAGRFNEAKKVLQDALLRLPLEHVLYGYLAGVHWKLDEKEEALAAARKAISIDPEYEWAWRAIKEWSEKLNQPNLAAELARDLTVKKPRDVSAWLTYAGILDTDGARFSQEQLDAVEKALKLDPQNVLGLAMKANVLADAGRFDEAIAVCQTKFSDGYRHEQLRYVQAGIEMTRGNYGESVRQLEELAASNPDYYLAWERLASIYSGWEEKSADYLRVAREMTRLAPQNSVTFGYLGEACLLNGRRDEAKNAFQQAIKLSPEYEFGANALFDLYFEDSELQNCKAILKTHREFIKNDNSLVREIAFYAKQNDLENIAPLWKKLCFSATADDSHFDYVLEKFRYFKLMNEPFVYETLLRSSKEANVNPLVGAYLIELCGERESVKKCRKIVEEFRGNEKIWAQAMKKFLNLMLRSKSGPEVYSFIKKNWNELKKTDDLWALTGYALNALEQDRKACELFSDWRERKGVMPWMLWNYVISLRRQGKAEEANSISRAALNLPERDSVVSQHRMMIGLDELHAGNFENAAQLFSQIDTRVLSDWDRYFYYLLETGLAIYEKNARGLKEEADELMKEMVKDSLADSTLRADKVRLNSFRRTVETALAMSRNSRLKFYLRARLALSWLYFQMTKNYA
ncbi:MAG: tetratricopeptide repeat protein [Acidobacteriota bacterium]|nr:tetratricopeptide repeat protein [Acidobacteriota bacterium]